MQDTQHYLGGALSGKLRIAIVRKRAPPGLQRHLNVTVADYRDDYERLHEITEAYFRARGSVIPIESGEMRVDVLQTGRSFPVQQMKPGAGELVCYRCGGRGHRARDCATPAPNASTTSTRSTPTGRPQPWASQQVGQRPQQKSQTQRVQPLLVVEVLSPHSSASTAVSQVISNVIAKALVVKAEP